jgi:enterochelin esterase-like enzyme
MARFGVALLAAMLLAGAAQAQVSVVAQQAYSPEGAQQFVLKSQKLGRDFVVVVTPPASPLVPGMKGPGPNQKLAAVYALDGGYGVVGPLAQMLAMSGVTAPAYVVSVSYPPGAGQRNTDLLYRPVTEGAATYGGGGAAFRAFLTDELKPFLEGRFPLDPARAVLLGHSFGGLFAANVLAEAPESFAGYVIASASVWRDPGLPQRLAAAAPQAKGRRVFVAAGGREDARMQAAAREVAQALNTTGSGVKVELQLFEDGNHLSYYPKLAQAGLAWTLPSNAAGRVPTSIAIQAMDQVVGVYLMPDGRNATITRRNAALIAQLTGLPGETELLAETSRRFFIPGGFDVTMTFEGPDGQPATGLVLNMGGAEARATRTSP